MVNIALTFFLVMAGLFLGVLGLRVFLQTAVDLGPTAAGHLRLTD